MCAVSVAPPFAAAAAAAPGIASKTKTKKKHFVCQKVKLFRASEPILSVLMWGVNHTINELSNVPVPVMLMPDDFKAYSKIKVDNHLFNKENLPSRFKFKEYCPMVFRNLRERFGIDDQDYQVWGFLQNGRGQGVEGSQEATGQIEKKMCLFWSSRRGSVVNESN
uniref:Uncharacterized protein n=1 Tax=Sus scrofa TaxID=9823 RepID=A0A8D0XIK7_PIG